MKSVRRQDRRLTILLQTENFLSIFHWSSNCFAKKPQWIIFYHSFTRVWLLFRLRRFYKRLTTIWLRRFYKRLTAIWLGRFYKRLTAIWLQRFYKSLTAIWLRRFYKRLTAIWLRRFYLMKKQNLNFWGQRAKRPQARRMTFRKLKKIKKYKLEKNLKNKTNIIKIVGNIIALLNST